VRADPASWRDASYRWFSRKPANRALLVFTRDEATIGGLEDPSRLPATVPPGGTPSEGDGDQAPSTTTTTTLAGSAP